MAKGNRGGKRANNSSALAISQQDLQKISDDELKKYEDMLEEIIDSYDPVTLYDGYTVKLKPNIVETEVLKRAKYAINDIDQIFECDYGKY